MRRLLIAMMLGAPALHAAEAGVSATEIVVGQNITLQGGKNGYGTAALDGIKLYFDAVNAGGGVLGRKLVLRTLDDDNKAAAAATAIDSACWRTRKEAAVIAPASRSPRLQDSS